MRRLSLEPHVVNIGRLRGGHVWRTLGLFSLRQSVQSHASARETTHPNQSAFPKGVSGPALRALHGAGVRSLRDLTRWSEADLARLHGMGPKALGALTAAMKDEGLEFRK